MSNGGLEQWGVAQARGIVIALAVVLPFWLTVAVAAWWLS